MLTCETTRGLTLCVCGICCYYIPRDHVSRPGSTVECCHMVIIADQWSPLCPWQHKCMVCVCVCVCMCTLVHKRVCTCVCFLSMSEACSARSKSFTRSVSALLSLSPLLTASSCCWRNIWVVVRRSSSPRFPTVTHTFKIGIIFVL